VKHSSLIAVERIEKAIYLIRSERVMSDRDLADLYGVPTKAFNQAVKRHADRFPPDFMFQLTMQEAREWWTEETASRLRSQNVTLKCGQHIKYRPSAFTEHGILMLSSVLNSERSIQVNIEIMRAFVKLRRMLASNAELSRRFDERGSSPTVREGFESSRSCSMPFDNSCRRRSHVPNKLAFDPAPSRSRSAPTSPPTAHRSLPASPLSFCLKHKQTLGAK